MKCLFLCSGYVFNLSSMSMFVPEVFASSEWRRAATSWSGARTTWQTEKTRDRTTCVRIRLRFAGIHGSVLTTGRKIAPIHGNSLPWVAALTSQIRRNACYHILGLYMAIWNPRMTFMSGPLLEQALYSRTRVSRPQIVAAPRFQLVYWNLCSLLDMLYISWWKSTTATIYY